MSQWTTHVRPKLIEEIDDLRDSLVTAPLDNVVRLQERVGALQTILKWFEEGSPQDKQISSDGPIGY